ncbi:MAG TPA: VOC family protein [Pyrinomonadaceae bacterium]|nr:VOC family protein [Acidobacteriota bacterium]HQZ97616.1 VOC family protein [Pyrinomonadaceae bacterium]
MSQKITTFLMFNDQAEEAMNLYTSVFPNSRIISTMPTPDGKVAGGSFEISGQRYNCYNAGPHPNFVFSQGISLMIAADTQDEVDHYYDKLSEGGEEQACGWLKDKFGVSWQVTPTMLMQNLNDPDRAKAGRVMEAMFKMKKIIIADLETAATG